jgi:copper(I)-binding protein
VISVRKLLRLETAGAVALLLAAPLTAVQAQVVVTGAWARASLPHQDDAAVYLSLTSKGGDTLTGAASPEADMAMLHKTTEGGGGMSGMADVDSVALPAGKTVSFSPGTMHIMLMGLKHPLKPGGTVSLSLNFTHAGSKMITVPVKPVTASGP